MSDSLGRMADGDERPAESPATWENVVVGEAKEFIGRITGDKELADEGEAQVEVAHEVRNEAEEAERDT
jgi:uncharacterized protein YjbJ (UPF0337 family)